MIGSIVGGIIGIILSFVIIDELHPSPVKAFFIALCITYLYSTVTAIWFKENEFDG